MPKVGVKVRTSVPGIKKTGRSGFPVAQHQTGLRVRFSVRKTACSSTTPPTSTGNPGEAPISAKISRFGQWSTFNMDSGV